MTLPNSHLRISELMRRAQQARTREEAQVIIAEATLLKELDSRLRG